MKRSGPPSVVVLDAPQSYPSEAYRVLRANLHYANPDAPLRTVLVTSASPGEGKTTTVANLGVCLAETERRVCLVDADLRQPALHAVFDRPKTPGLSTYLAGDALLEAVTSETRVPGLTVVTSGPSVPNPAVLLASRRMRQFLDDAAARFDLVLVDSTPVLAVSDVCGFAPLVDGVLMVVASGQEPLAVLRRAKDQLEAIQARVVAAVINRFDARANGYSRRYYSRYDRYYGEKRRRRRTEESDGGG